MSRLLPLLLVAGLLPLAADAKRPAIPAATPTGKAESCVPLQELRSSQVRDDSTIDFIVSSRKAYRVTLPRPCPDLGLERAFTYETSLTQLCSTDIITVLRQSSGGDRRGASCGLAEFQPVTLAR